MHVAVTFCRLARFPRGDDEDLDVRTPSDGSGGWLQDFDVRVPADSLGWLLLELVVAEDTQGGAGRRGTARVARVARAPRAAVVGNLVGNLQDAGQGDHVGRGGKMQAWVENQVEVRVWLCRPRLYTWFQV